MTGMQVNPGTDEAFQPPGSRRVDLARLIPALGVEHFFVIDPFELEESTEIIQKCLTLPGVKVVLARQECAIQAQRRGLEAGKVRGGSRELYPVQAVRRRHRLPGHRRWRRRASSLTPAQCYGCGLCAQVCKFEAMSVASQRSGSERVK